MVVLVTAIHVFLLFSVSYKKQKNVDTPHAQNMTAEEATVIQKKGNRLT